MIVGQSQLDDDVVNYLFRTPPVEHPNNELIFEAARPQMLTDALVDFRGIALHPRETVG